MNHPRSLAVLVPALAAALVSGCGPKRIRMPTRPGEAMVVLLPDPDDGTVGRAVVSNPAGAAELVAARASVLVSPNSRPTEITVLNDADVKRLFGDALSALPPAAQHFTLYFLFESDELTDESRAQLPQIVQAVKNHPFPDVAAVGHTDTTGTPAGNFQLGLRRANAIRRRLIDIGLDASLIEVTSHGESDLLVKTADGVAEARNRRVEISVR